MAKRIHAIDAVRGFCLINIFVNHITLGVVNEISPSKIFFFDSADVFVLLAGMSAWLAYGARGSHFDLASCRDKMWSRAVKIYLVNVLLIGAGLAALILGASVAPPPDVSTTPAGLAAQHGWATYLWHALTMQQSVGYSMVLRLYFFLMVVGPAYLWLATRRWYWPLVPAFLIWLVAGSLTLVSRDSLTGVWLTMSVLSWNLLFAMGVSFAAAISSNMPLPKITGLVPAAVILTVGGILLLAFGSHVDHVANWLEVRNDHFWTGISKSLQSPLRLLHLAAAVVCIVWLPKAPLIRLIRGASPSAFLSKLGRRSLEVFTCGAILAVMADQVLWGLSQTQNLVLRSPYALLVELALIALALLAMGKLAVRTPREPAARSAAMSRQLELARP